MSNLPRVFLKDVASVNTNSLNKDFQHTQIRYIDISSVSDGKLESDGSKIPVETAPSRARRLLSPGDTVISTVRPANRAMFFAKSPDADWVVSTGFAVLSPDEKLIDPRFLYYSISDPAFTRYLVAHEKGAAYPAVSTEDLMNADIWLPPMEEQKKCAEILGNIDDKIDINLRIQFINEQIIRALVTKAFSKSDAPVGTLGDYCQNIKQSVKVADLSAELSYISFEHMPRGSIVLNTWGNAKGISSNKSGFKKRDILFGKLRPYFKKVGIAPIDGVASTDIIVLRPKSEIDTAIVAATAASNSLINSLSASATGTRMPRASWEDLRKWPVPILSKIERIDLARLTDPLIDSILAMSHENLLLAQTRDSLVKEIFTGRLGTKNGI